MLQIVLMKIEKVSFGLKESQLGIHFVFSTKNTGVSHSVAFWDYERVIPTENFKWTEDDRLAECELTMQKVSKYLKDAKVESIDQLKGIPVEVTLNNKLFKSFRILTEVL